MPNTLAHLGIQTIAGRLLIRPKARPSQDLLWLWLGCVLPDVPWILQRIAKQLIDGDARYDLRLYTVSLGTLLGCLVLAAAISTIARQPLRVFGLLSSTALLHLLLDGSQIKWGNGPILAAPFDWRPLPGFVWAENAWTLVLVGLGGLTVAALWRQATATRPELALGPRRLTAAALVGAVWLLLPLGLIPSAERHDVHGIRTLRERGTRAGRAIQFYNSYWRVPDKIPGKIPGSGSGPLPEARLLTMTSEPLSVRGLPVEPPARVSVKAHFLNEDTVQVDEFHVHRSTRRDIFSYLGLSIVALAWLGSLRPRQIHRTSEQRAKLEP